MLNEILLIVVRFVLLWGLIKDDLSIILVAGFYMVALTIETNKEG